MFGGELARGNLITKIGRNRLVLLSSAAIEQPNQRKQRDGKDD